jgi:putative hemolysin
LDIPGPSLLFLDIIRTPLTAGVFAEFLIILFLLFCSAFISGAEVAFFSLKPAELGHLKKSKHKTDQLVLSMLTHPKRLLASVLIFNILCNISMIVLTTLFIQHLFYLEKNPTLAFVLQVVVVTLVIVLFGESVPKIYAQRFALQVSRVAGIPVFIIDKILTPFSYLLVRSSNFLDRITRKRYLEVTSEELAHAIDITADKSTPTDEKNILKGIARFTHIDVKQVMTARTDVVALEIRMKFPEIFTKVFESGYSRMPVYEGTFDNIKGIFHVKDMLPFLQHKDDAAFDWRKIIRPAHFVPESKKINDLLREFQDKKTHLAIVVDEFGGAGGIVTLEDILEEIIGDIRDEFDDEQVEYSKLSDTVFVFEGKTLLNDVARIMNTDRKVFDVGNEDVDTLAGLVLELKGTLPAQNEVIKFKNMTFTIESMGKRRIKRIKINVNEHKESDTAEPPSSAGENGSSSNDNVVYSWLLIAALFFCGCDEGYTPRPKGYFRLEFPEKKYERVETGNCPYTFEMPVYSKLVPDTASTAEPCWFNMEFPKLNATIYLSYKKVDHNISTLIEDHRRITMKHISMASGIDEVVLTNPQKKVYGVIQYVKGNAASPLQFYVTDSVHHFLRGSLYFYAIPNPDSLAPAEKFVQEDINHMLNTVEWK